MWWRKYFSTRIGGFVMESFRGDSAVETEIALG
jgi:hypothetical protein